MRDDLVEVGVYQDRDEVREEEDTWIVVDKETYKELFGDFVMSIRGVQSKDEQLISCWSSEEIIIIESREVVRVINVSGISEALTGNDGTIVALNGENFDQDDILYLFDSEGAQILQDTFESSTAALAISPDGQYAAVATAFPDNAIHIYETGSGEYIGRTENIGTSVLTRLQFAERDGKQVVETYDYQNEIIDTIIVEPQYDAMQLEGIGIIPDISVGTWHLVCEEVIEEVTGSLRVPGVELKTSCNREIEVLTADQIIDDPKNAIKSSYEFCSECKAMSATYPDSKTERTQSDY